MTDRPEHHRFFADKTVLPPEYHNSCVFTEDHVYCELLGACYGDANQDADDVWTTIPLPGSEPGDRVPRCRLLPGAVLACDLPMIKALGRRKADFNQDIAERFDEDGPCN